MNYNKLKALIERAINSNGRQAITGDRLRDILLVLVDSLNVGYHLIGDAHVGDRPPTPEQPSMWLAAEPGTYTGFGNVEVTDLTLLFFDTEWHSASLGVPFESTVTEAIREAVKGGKEDLKEAVETIGEALRNEETNRVNADRDLRSRVDAEETNRANADVSLSAKVNQEISDRETAVSEEASARAQEDEKLSDRISKETVRATTAEQANATAIADETTARRQADTTLFQTINAETTRAQAAEKSNAERISKEIADRKAALSEEATARQQADTQLRTDLSTETARAKAAEQANADAVTAEASARESAVAAEAQARAASDEQIGSRISDIEEKIPAQASETNKLADKAFVNSSRDTNTAHFIGTFEDLDTLKAQEATNNDYAFYSHLDEAGNRQFDRYKYNGTEWLYEYTLNNSSLTAAQWAAINSGSTQELIDYLPKSVEATGTGNAITDVDIQGGKLVKTKGETFATAQELSEEAQSRSTGDTAQAEALSAEVTRAKASEQANAEAIANEATARAEAIQQQNETIASLQTTVNEKQDTLVSGTNIKTINGQSVLGDGDLSVSGGGDVIMLEIASIGDVEDIGYTVAELTAAIMAGNRVVMYFGPYDMTFGSVNMAFATYNGQSALLFESCWSPLPFNNIPDNHTQVGEITVRLYVPIEVSTSRAGHAVLINERFDVSQAIESGGAANGDDVKIPSLAAVRNAFVNAGKMPIVQHGTSDTTLALTPDVYHSWYGVSALILSLAAAPEDGVVHRYMAAFVSPATPTQLSVSGVRWRDDTVPTVTANRQCVLEVVDGCAELRQYGTPPFFKLEAETFTGSYTVKYNALKGVEKIATIDATPACLYEPISKFSISGTGSAHNARITVKRPSALNNLVDAFSMTNNLDGSLVLDLDTSEVTSMQDMLKGRAITSVDVSSFDTSKVRWMGGMFRETRIKTLNLSNFDTSNVEDMSTMFMSCYSLETVDVSSFNTSKVVDMQYMFKSCEKLTTLDLWNFDTSHLDYKNNMNFMFQLCTHLETLDVSNFSIADDMMCYQMFDRCNVLASVRVAHCSLGTVSKLINQLNTDNAGGSSNWVKDGEYLKPSAA